MSAALPRSSVTAGIEADEHVRRSAEVERHQADEHVRRAAEVAPHRGAVGEHVRRAAEGAPPRAVGPTNMSACRARHRGLGPGRRCRPFVRHHPHRPPERPPSLAPLARGRGARRTAGAPSTAAGPRRPAEQQLACEQHRGRHRRSRDPSSSRAEQQHQPARRRANPRSSSSRAEQRRRSRDLLASTAAARGLPPAARQATRRGHLRSRQDSAASYSRGTLTAVEDPAGRVDLDHDVRGHIVRVTRQFAAHAGPVTPSQAPPRQRSTAPCSSARRRCNRAQPATRARARAPARVQGDHQTAEEPGEL